MTNVDGSAPTGIYTAKHEGSISHVETTLPELWTVNDVADWLKVPSKKVKRMARRGDIPCAAVVGDEMLFDRAALYEWWLQQVAKRDGEGKGDGS